MENSTSFSKYQKFCDLHETTLPLFYQPWYLNAVCKKGRWIPMVYEKNNQAIAIWPCFIKEFYGFKYITMPHLTPSMGPWLIVNKGEKQNKYYSRLKEITTKMANQLPSTILTAIHLIPGNKAGLYLSPFGYKLFSRYTYRLDLTSKDQLWKGISSKQKSTITNAQQSLIIEESNDISLFYSLNTKTFDRQNRQIPYNFELLSQLDKALMKHQCRTILTAKDNSGNYHGAIYLVHDQQKVYCLAIGSDPIFRSQGSIPLLIWTGIQKFIPTHTIFDFEGSMIAPIEKFFRSFGGTLTPYTRIQKTPNRVVEILLTLFGKI